MLAYVQSAEVDRPWKIILIYFQGFSVRQDSTIAFFEFKKKDYFKKTSRADDL